MELRYTIYSHQHVESGRRYIGLTKLTMMKRWNQHAQNAKAKRGKGCAHFWAAIRAYGKDAFSHEVLEVCETLELANLAERKWISFYDTRNPERGFNLADGGKHEPHPIRKNPWDNPEYRQKVSVSVKKALSDPSDKPRQSATSLEVHSRDDVKVKLSNASLAMWRRDDYKEKQAEWSGSSKFREQCFAGLTRGADILRSKTHCVNGHEFTEDNTRMVKGRRICKACHRDVCRSIREELKKNPEKLADRRAYNRERTRESRARRLNSL